MTVAAPRGAMAVSRRPSRQPVQSSVQLLKYSARNLIHDLNDGYMKKNKPQDKTETVIVG